jgi:hypothetical protein
MDIDTIVNFLMPLLQKLPVVLPILIGVGTAVVGAESYIESTASKDDDAWLAKLYAKAPLAIILNIVKKFSVVGKK